MRRDWEGKYSVEIRYINWWGNGMGMEEGRRMRYRNTEEGIRYKSTRRGRKKKMKRKRGRKKKTDTLKRRESNRRT